MTITNFAIKREQSNDAGASTELSLLKLCRATRSKTIVKLVWIAEPTQERTQNQVYLNYVERQGGRQNVNSEQSQDDEVGLRRKLSTLSSVIRNLNKNNTIMKKAYIAPSVEVIKVAVANILANSQLPDYYFGVYDSSTESDARM